MATKLHEVAARQALIARIPEVVSQVAPTIVAVQGGHIVCPKRGTNARLYCTDGTTELSVTSFYVMNRCVSWFWWDVYAADTGRKSPYNGFSGGSGCFHMEVASSLESPNNSYSPTEKDNIVSLTDINGFVEWLSAYTGSHWRLPTDTELEFLYQQMVAASGVDSKTQSPHPALKLATSQCSVDSNYYQQSTVERRCSPPSWELSNNCPRNYVESNSSTTTPKSSLDCQNKQRSILSLQDISSSTLDYKGKLSLSESFGMLRSSYPGPYLDYLDRDYRLSKSIEFRLVRE